MKNLMYEFYIAGSPEAVWKALISPESTKQIYYGSIIRSTFQVGDLLEYEPNQLLRFTHYPGKSYMKDDRAFESRISYILKPIGSCTKLILIHDQWKEDDPYYENSNKAWWMILNNTKTLVETGSTLDFGEIS
ncbi:TPA: polyketide cyclase [Bacillus mycoides]|nr:polyketide cyclase [Bacillus mycoides]